MDRRLTPKVVAAYAAMAIVALLGLVGIALATNFLVAATNPYATIARDDSLRGVSTPVAARSTPSPVGGFSRTDRLVPAGTPTVSLTAPTVAPPVTVAATLAIAPMSATTSVPTIFVTTISVPTIAPVAVTDPLDNLGGIADRSAGLTIDTINQGFIGGDPARLVRTGRTSEWAVWALPGMTSFTAVTYHFIWERPVGTFVFEASPDGAIYAAVAPTITDRGGDWRRIDYALALPAGTVFVRVTFPNDSAYLWTPQIGQVMYWSDAEPRR